MNHSRFERQRVPADRIPPVVQYKWTAQLLDEGFTPFPKRLIRSCHSIFVGDLGIEHLAVVLAIADFNRPNLTRQPSVDYLAFCSGLSVSQTNTCITDLESAGLLETSVSGGETSYLLGPLFTRIAQETAE